MDARSLLTILGLATVLFTSPFVSAAPPPAPTAFMRAFLHDRMGFGNRDIADLASGRPIAKLIHADNGTDVSVFGAVHIAVPPDALVAELRDIDRFERRLGVLEVGKFHDPPEPADVAALTLDPADVAALGRCRPGDCPVQLSARAMTEFRQRLDPPGDDGARRDAARAQAMFRTMVMDVVGRYRRGGIAALEPYADRRPPVSVATEFARLDARRAVPDAVANLVDYVTKYPNAVLPGAEDFYYWNKADFGMKPTARVNHVTIYPIAGLGERPDGLRYAIATVQLYAAHYFAATFELRTIVDDDARSGRGCYLLYTSRSRVDGLTGLLGAFIRPMARSRARSGMERYLENTRRAAEAAYAERAQVQ